MIQKRRFHPLHFFVKTIFLIFQFRKNGKEEEKKKFLKLKEKLRPLRGDGRQEVENLSEV